MLTLSCTGRKLAPDAVHGVPTTQQRTSLPNRHCVDQMTAGAILNNQCKTVSHGLLLCNSRDSVQITTACWQLGLASLLASSKSNGTDVC